MSRRISRRVGVLADAITAYEQDELDEQETIQLFQDLVNTGLAWSLQGYYGRVATDLIRAGLVTEPPPAS